MTSPTSPTLGRAAMRLWLARADDATKRTEAQWAEYLDWYRRGRSDPGSCVHYSTIAEALRDARVILEALLPPDDSTVEAKCWKAVRPFHDEDDLYIRTHYPKDFFRIAFTSLIQDILKEQDHG